MYKLRRALITLFRISAPKGERIEIEFVDFLFITHDNEECQRQSLSIRDPEVEDIIGKYCGNTKPPNYSSMGDQLFMLLNSESVGEYKVYFCWILRKIIPSIRDFTSNTESMDHQPSQPPKSPQKVLENPWLRKLKRWCQPGLPRVALSSQSRNCPRFQWKVHQPHLSSEVLKNISEWILRCRELAITLSTALVFSRADMHHPRSVPFTKPVLYIDSHFFRVNFLTKAYSNDLDKRSLKFVTDANTEIDQTGTTIATALTVSITPRCHHTN